MYLGLPPEENDFYAPGVNYTLHQDLLFVFGANTGGRHGKGSALAAIKKYGAIYGQGAGLQGRSYGIPTKSSILIVLEPLVIESYVEDFLQFLLENPERSCFVCAVGTMNAGYSHEQIAPMFRGAKRCWFDERWKPYLV